MIDSTVHSARAQRIQGRCAAELEAALPEAVAACEALAKLGRDGPWKLEELRAAASRAAHAAGLVAGFAFMSMS